MPIAIFGGISVRVGVRFAIFTDLSQIVVNVTAFSYKPFADSLLLNATVKSQESRHFIAEVPCVKSR